MKLNTKFMKWNKFKTNCYKLTLLLTQFCNRKMIDAKIMAIFLKFFNKIKEKLKKLRDLFSL